MTDPQTGDLAATKRLLRRQIRDRVRSMPPADRLAESAAVVSRLLEAPGFATASTVLLYLGHLAEEWDTRPLITACFSRGQRVFLPRVVREEHRLALIEVRALDELIPGTLGIPEPPAGAPESSPSLVDWALIPGLAFDPLGFRLGRGAGHYDRLLPSLRPDVPLWSGAFSPQLVDRLPAEPHDLPVDAIVLPDRMVGPEAP
jgi:5-formyltetrahydrofolate cyclo-ligase